VVLAIASDIVEEAASNGPDAPSSVAALRWPLLGILTAAQQLDYLRCKRLSDGVSEGDRSCAVFFLFLVSAFSAKRAVPAETRA
jgi:hypothetical protein